MNVSGDFLRTGQVTGSEQSGGVANQPENDAAAASGASSQTADTASLSHAGAAASAASSTGSDIRSEKVASVQSALVSGSYNVPPTEVASSVIDHMLTNG